MITFFRAISSHIIGKVDVTGSEISPSDDIQQEMTNRGWTIWVEACKFGCRKCQTGLQLTYREASLDISYTFAGGDDPGSEAFKSAF
jgi:hypothetical protein